ncbi:hypothetical protein PMIN03_005071 [Paraphaeosphaeria minitans]
MMPSQRRTRLYVLLLALAIITTLYMTRSSSQTRTSPFYVKTQEALQTAEYVEASKHRDAEKVGSRLKAAADDARKAAEEKGQKFVDSVTGGDADKAPRGRYSNNKDGKQQPLEGVAVVGGRTQDKKPPKENETEDYHEAEVELNTILKKSPIIIFSKTYCPHSRKAKHILLETYDIDPAPYVVELDEHPIGLKLQEVLADTTGRRTVPNVMVLGQSIGGGDQMQELDETDTMAETIKKLGDTRITRVTRRAKYALTLTLTLTPLPAYLPDPGRAFPPRLPMAINPPNATTRTLPSPARLALAISSPLTSPLRAPSSIASSPAPSTMCTYFTLTYKCGHTQTSHRCPRSTIYIYSKNGEQVPRVIGCDSTHVLGGGLPDVCIDCKMAEGHMPGVATGVDKWSLWGPREDAMAARVKMVQAGVSEAASSPVEGGAVQEGWEEQVRTALVDQGRGQTGTPDTTASSARSGSIQERVNEQDEEDDEWMWGGMKNFGGEKGRKRGKATTVRTAQAWDLTNG